MARREGSCPSSSGVAPILPLTDTSPWVNEIQHYQHIRHKVGSTQSTLFGCWLSRNNNVILLEGRDWCRTCPQAEHRLVDKPVRCLLSGRGAITGAWSKMPYFKAIAAMQFCYRRPLPLLMVQNASTSLLADALQPPSDCGRVDKQPARLVDRNQPNPEGSPK